MNEDDTFPSTEYGAERPDDVVVARTKLRAAIDERNPESGAGDRCRAGNRPMTRRALVAAAALAAFLPSMQASAQTAWPTRPIKLIVPFAPGGSNDNIARVLANKLSAQLGQPIIVDNKSGGGGTIGTDFVAKSPPDGYTLLLASTSITSNAASGKKLPYDLVRDLQAAR